MNLFRLAACPNKSDVGNNNGCGHYCEAVILHGYVYYNYVFAYPYV